MRDNEFTWTVGESWKQWWNIIIQNSLSHTVQLLFHNGFNVAHVSTWGRLGSFYYSCFWWWISHICTHIERGVRWFDCISVPHNSVVFRLLSLQFVVSFFCRLITLFFYWIMEIRNFLSFARLFAVCLLAVSQWTYVMRYAIHTHSICIKRCIYLEIFHPKRFRSNENTHEQAFASTNFK